MSIILLPDLTRRLRITDSADDGQLTVVLLAAEQAVMSWCGRSFELASASTSTRTYLPCGDEVLVDDIATTVGLVVTDDGATVSNTDLVLDPANGIGPDGRTGWPYWRLRFIDGHCWSTNYNQRTCSVTAKWGWPSVPPALKEAALLLASDLFAARDTKLGVAGFGEFGVVRIRENGLLQSLLAPFRRFDRVGVA